MAQKSEIQAQIDEIVTGANYRANQMRPMLTDMLDYASAGQTPVFTGLVANGTTASTTLVLNVGVNIIGTATTTNYACKLPQPVTGQRVTVVNTSSRPISLYPSNPGGQINNYPINAPAIIPPDRRAYDFICIENPLPGAWVWSPPAISQIEYSQIDVSHTNGVTTNAYGYSTSTLTFVGPTISTDINGNIVFTGNFTSELAPTRCSRIKCYSNIVESDVGTSFSNGITVNLRIGFKSSVNSVDLFTAFTQKLYGNALFPPQGVQFAGVGTLNSPPEIGDTDTMFTIYDFPLNNNNIQIGSGGQFSSYYYQFAMFIPASAATKTYKFKFFIEYY